MEYFKIVEALVSAMQKEARHLVVLNQSFWLLELLKPHHTGHHIFLSIILIARYLETGTDRKKYNYYVLSCLIVHLTLLIAGTFIHLQDFYIAILVNNLNVATCLPYCYYRDMVIRTVF